MNDLSHILNSVFRELFSVELCLLVQSFLFPWSVWVIELVHHFKGMVRVFYTLFTSCQNQDLNDFFIAVDKFVFCLFSLAFNMKWISVRKLLTFLNLQVNKAGKILNFEQGEKFRAAFQWNCLITPKVSALNP